MSKSLLRAFKTHTFGQKEIIQLVRNNNYIKMFLMNCTDVNKKLVNFILKINKWT